jgi:hypothetical protein
VSLGNALFGPGGIGPACCLQTVWDEKPTGNASLTWIKGNHSYKFGGELMIEGFPVNSFYEANGAFGISKTETGDPAEQALGLAGSLGTTGFPYASFLLGKSTI